MNYRTPRIVQPGHRPLWGWLALLLLLALLLGAGWYGFNNAQWRTPAPDLQKLRAELAGQVDRIAELEQERDRLLEQVAILERAGQIDREAVRQVREQLAAFQEERSKMEEELTFLRSMVSTKEDRNGIQIQRLVLAADGGDGRYRYKFTITRNMQSDGMATGWIFFAVDGIRDGEPVWLPLREITEDNTDKLKMRFRHFQDIEGQIRLPEGFKPLKVIIEVKSNNKKFSPVKQRFDWKLES